MEKVNAAIGRMVSGPAILARFAATGTKPLPPGMRSPAEHAKWLASEFARFETMFMAAGIATREAK